MLVADGEVVLAAAVESEEVERRLLGEADARASAVEEARAGAVLRRALREEAARAEREVLAADGEVDAAVEEVAKRQLELVEDELVRPFVGLRPRVLDAELVAQPRVEREILAEVDAGEEARTDPEVVVVAAARDRGLGGLERDVVEALLPQAQVAARAEADAGGLFGGGCGRIVRNGGRGDEAEDGEEKGACVHGVRFYQKKHSVATSGFP